MATPQKPPESKPAASGYTIDQFVASPLGKLLVGILTPLTRVTVMKAKDAQGKAVERTPLDSLWGTVIAGVVLLIALVIAAKIAAGVS